MGGPVTEDAICTDAPHDDQPAPASATPDAGRRLGAVFLWCGVVVCLAVAAMAGYLSFHAQYDFEFAHDGGNQIAASMFAALADSVIAATSMIALYRAVSGRMAGKISVVNLAFIGLSTMLNAFQAQPGTKGLATAIVPPIAFAITFHLILDELREHILIKRGGQVEGRSALEIALGLVLWQARLLVNPVPTLRELRRYIMEVAPSVPGGRLRPAPQIERTRTRQSRGARHTARPKSAADGEAAAATIPVPAQRSPSPKLTAVDGASLTDRQKAARAEAVYLAYKADGWALDHVRLAQLSGYSERNSRRKLADLAQAHGFYRTRHAGDDTAFALQVLEQLRALDGEERLDTAV